MRKHTLDMIECAVNGDDSITPEIRRRLLEMFRKGGAEPEKVPSRMLTPTEAARVLGLKTPVALRRLERRGKIKAVRLNRKLVRYREADVLALV